MVDIAIIGCGVVGASTAFALSKYNLSILVLEKENDVALGASRANSAIIHAGYDPQPNTLMARLNVQGNQMTEALCKDLSVDFQRIGSLVLAFTHAELQTVQALYERGIQNGVPDMELWSAEQVQQKEPHISESVLGALYAPSAGIINPWEYTLALAETAVRNGVTLQRNTEVTQIDKQDSAYHITTNQGNFTARTIINAAGAYSDRIHEMVAPKTFTIHPNRGEYYLMDKCDGALAHHVLFQCPNEDGKGVLVSPTVDGNLIVGPNSEAVADPECTCNTAEGLAFVREKARKTMPTLNFRNSIRNFAGIRANTDVDEFHIGIAADHFIDLAGIKSPGLSSAPAIAQYAVELVKQCGLPLSPKENAITTRSKQRFHSLTQEAKAKQIAQDPLYGRIICRCETITEGEIVQAVHNPIPPYSLDAVKRRTGTGMGRCQGGFCGPRVLDILARELQQAPTDILQNRSGSNILLCETKTGD